MIVYVVLGFIAPSVNLALHAIVGLGNSTVLFTSSTIKFEDVEEVHRFMVQKVADNEGKIDKVYFCPQLKSVQDNYRKPSPKMAYFAQRRLLHTAVQSSHAMVSQWLYRAYATTSS